MSLFGTFLCSCPGKKIKEHVNTFSEKAGEVVGETVKGLSRGVENAFEIKISKNDTLAVRALETGKVLPESDSNANDNGLSVYFIYNNDFNRDVLLKVYDKSGLEMGCCRRHLAGKKEGPGYTAFVFDAKTNIDRDCTIIIE